MADTNHIADPPPPPSPHLANSLWKPVSTGN
uniref:Uncharacterized protein n=1 Tax=Anguilla anguilla TaxID=7936 RepID=A0A0E9UM25_ANGAN